mmetsp:Transcript_32216/g.75746  ORF Transcript_32216/g.75746 Transcript_32216/m.75746 type:complete len:201 (+) Transcript_32216:253-855(+)
MPVGSHLLSFSQGSYLGQSHHRCLYRLSCVFRLTMPQPCPLPPRQLRVKPPDSQMTNWQTQAVVEFDTPLSQQGSPWLECYASGPHPNFHPHPPRSLGMHSSYECFCYSCVCYSCDFASEVESWWQKTLMILQRTKISVTILTQIVLFRNIQLSNGEPMPPMPLRALNQQGHFPVLLGDLIDMHIESRLAYQAASEKTLI